MNGEDEASNRHGADEGDVVAEPAAPTRPNGRTSPAQGGLLRLACRWVVPAMLSALGIACLGAAWSLYPIEKIPHRADPFDVGISGSAPEVSQVAVSLGENVKEDFSAVTVRVARALGAADGEISVGISIDGHFLKDIDDVSCDPRCTIDELSKGSVNPYTFFSMDLSKWRELPASNQLVADAVMQIPNSLLGRDDDAEVDTLGMRCTRLACRGITPYVRYAGDVHLTDSPTAVVGFWSPTLGEYNWDGDLQPRFVDKKKAFMTLEFPLTGLTDNSRGSAYRLDGDNPNESRTVEFKTFLSGAFVGLAGALILAAFQEGLTTRRSRISDGTAVG